MHNSGDAAAGVAILIGLMYLAGIIFLVCLFVAPIKLYSIHREIRRSNDLLKRQTELLVDALDGNRAQAGMLAALVQVAKNYNRQCLLDTFMDSQIASPAVSAVCAVKRICKLRFLQK